MAISDNLGDMLTRIKNGYLANKKTVNCFFAKEKEAVLKVLLAKNVIKKYVVNSDLPIKTLEIQLLDGPKALPDLLIKRISKPGRRVYIKAKNIYKVKGGTGFLLISTPLGIMDGESATKQKQGGELLALIAK